MNLRSRQPAACADTLHKCNSGLDNKEQEMSNILTQQVTIGFAIHRPEMVPLTAKLMQSHELIILEEPSAPGFSKMLKNELAIDEYLMEVDVEFPEFSRGMCALLQALHKSGKIILQVEPYLEYLLEIHDFFARGHSPDEIEQNTVQHQVYLAERHATSALLDYYRTVMGPSFELAIKAIKRFARLDAARFRLRDALRVEAIVSQLKSYSAAYIEAGTIHYTLLPLLRRRLPQKVTVKPVFLAHEALKSMDQTGHLYGPGDRLTLLYIFHPNHSDELLEDILAARSLVYSKLIAKEEFSTDLKNYPHVRDEFYTIKVVEQLDLEDCRRLFPLIRTLKTDAAYDLVNDYLGQRRRLAPAESYRQPPQSVDASIAP